MKNLIMFKTKNKFINFNFFQGTHSSLPRVPKYFIDTIDFVATFTYDSRYDVGKEQSDWNKLMGIASNPLNHADNTAFVVWRLYNNQFEVAPYFNINKKIILPLQEQIFSSGKFNNDKNFSWKVRCRIDMNKGLITFFDPDPIWVFPIPRELREKFNILKSSRVQPYFGGNAKPNRDLSIKIDFL